MTDGSTTPGRFCLAFLKPDAAVDGLKSNDQDIVRSWIGLGRPAIIAGHADPGTLRLGIPLPPADRKRRLGFYCATNAVDRCILPPTLSVVEVTAPTDWKPDLTNIQQILGRDPRVHGSLLWQHLTGLPYLAPLSDIDLLLCASNLRTACGIGEKLALAESKITRRIDGEIFVEQFGWVAWRELCMNSSATLLVKNDFSGRLVDCNLRAAHIAKSAMQSVLAEMQLHPKPGLVTPRSNGCHRDMDANLLDRSARSLYSGFFECAVAGAHDANFGELRQIGLAAEKRMLSTTGGVNTHRGALFSLGLLAAAAGFRSSNRKPTLGDIVRIKWGAAIEKARNDTAAGKGARAALAAGMPDARTEAGLGFPSVYSVGLPELRKALAEGISWSEALLQVFFRLLSVCSDTNLLHRGGVGALRMAQRCARDFLNQGGVREQTWARRADRIGDLFLQHRWSPGGTADLLASTLLVHCLEPSGEGELCELRSFQSRRIVATGRMGRV
jgi:triphosphoribosyl-dephospho-CoA synthase